MYHSQGFIIREPELNPKASQNGPKPVLQIGTPQGCKGIQLQMQIFQEVTTFIMDQIKTLGGSRFGSGT